MLAGSFNKDIIKIINDINNKYANYELYIISDAQVEDGYNIESIKDQLERWNVFFKQSK